MSKYKLDMGQMAEVETVLEEMGNDPDSIAFELVWRRNESQIAGRAMKSIRNFPCGHIPNYSDSSCEACEALEEWDAIHSANTKVSQEGQRPEL